MFFYLFALWYVAIIFVILMFVLAKLAVVILPVAAVALIIWLVVRFTRKKS